MTAQEKAHHFLQIASQFKLGHLTTEGFHPKTTNLSDLVKSDVKKAHSLLQEVDLDALSIMESKVSLLWKLGQDIQDTLKSGHKVFMCGCGATGRLSLVLETLYRQNFGPDRVLSFMAGGDFALIKSVESFEDRVDYGERQLHDLGFGPHDLLLASTEGGETPFVIGAVHEAAKISSRSPWFLYCNPDDLLESIQRSREVLHDSKIHKANLTVGPMAISGSTRMQASTVLMLAIGVGLLYKHQDESSFKSFYVDFLEKLKALDYSQMAALTMKEAELYRSERYLNYLADPRLAISILTDTTERSPTFSLKGFENMLDHGSDHSLSYLFISEGETSAHAWSELLCRSPRALEWPELEGRISLAKVLGFDISLHGMKQRSQRISTSTFMIRHENGMTTFDCEGVKASFNLGEDLLFNHLAVKMLLNAHSTLIMGLLGRYEGNVMTYVRPSNNKLIDRAARYILQILKQKNKIISYERVVESIFEEMNIQDERPIVLRVVGKI